MGACWRPDTVSFGISSVRHGSIAASGKKSFSYTFSGTTKPAGIIDVALNSGASNTTTVASGIIREGSSTATNGTYYTLAIWGVMMNTSYYTSSVTNGLLANSDRAMGPAMSDATGTNVVFATVRGNSGNTTIATSISGVVTTQATSGSIFSNSSSDVIGLVPTVSGGIYTYTLYKNGVATALAWTDSTNIIGTPGRYPGGAFRHLFSSGQYSSPGIRAYAAADI